MKPKVQSWSRSLRNGVLTILIPLLIAIILRVFFIEMYKIPSSSMEPALLPGDFILVSKMSYGARLLKPVKFFKQKKIEYVRTKGWSSIKKGDIFVFNMPMYNKLSDSSSNIYGACLVKRCYGLPGDTVLINNDARSANDSAAQMTAQPNDFNNEGISLMKELRNERINNEVINDAGMNGMQRKYSFFPRDSSLRWSLDNYGPLYVPAKGQIMELTKRNVSWYRNILRYENPNSHIKDRSLMIDSKTVLQYTFQHNYYFMLGDNFYNSRDSRYWGFVPDNNVIGKVAMILFSIDPNGSGFKKFRLSRFLKTP
ncbi:MAG: signal peptidase I [Bacteroidia bacterium]|nr:signal peptidase I [Bacteroidia bacterium]